MFSWFGPGVVLHGEGCFEIGLDRSVPASFLFPKPLGDIFEPHFFHHLEPNPIVISKITCKLLLFLSFVLGLLEGSPHLHIAFERHVLQVNLLLCLFLPVFDQLHMLKYFIVQPFRKHLRRILVLLFNVVKLIFAELVEEGVEGELPQHWSFFLLLFLHHFCAVFLFRLAFGEGDLHLR